MPPGPYERTPMSVVQMYQYISTYSCVLYRRGSFSDATWSPPFDARFATSACRAWRSTTSSGARASPTLKLSGSGAAGSEPTGSSLSTSIASHCLRSLRRCHTSRPRLVTRQMATLLYNNSLDRMRNHCTLRRQQQLHCRFMSRLWWLIHEWRSLHLKPPSGPTQATPPPALAARPPRWPFCRHSSVACSTASYPVPRSTARCRSAGDTRSTRSGRRQRNAPSARSHWWASCMAPHSAMGHNRWTSASQRTQAADSAATICFTGLRSTRQRTVSRTQSSGCASLHFIEAITDRLSFYMI